MGCLRFARLKRSADCQFLFAALVDRNYGRRCVHVSGKWFSLSTNHSPCADLLKFQWVAGFVTFLFPQLKAAKREAIMPYHIFFGMSGFVLAIAAALLGLSEKAGL